MVTYLVSDKEVCSHENLQMPSNKQDYNGTAGTRTSALELQQFTPWTTIKHYAMSLFWTVQRKLTLLQLFTLYNSQNLPLPQVQTVSVGTHANDAICWPSISRSLVMEEARGSRPGGCWRRPALTGGVWGHSTAASSLCAAVASARDARTHNGRT